MSERELCKEDDTYLPEGILDEATALLPNKSPIVLPSVMSEAGPETTSSLTGW